MASISAVIITFNEAETIARCIESLLPVADEVIVIDSFSTDRTAAICQSLNIRFFQRSWEGYSAAKNYGNSLAIHTYILSIDADEVLSEKLQQSLLENKGTLDAGAYSFNRLTNYCGQWIRNGGWYPDSKIRMFKREQAMWTGDIHEKLVFSSPSSEKKLRGDLLHYSYTTIEHHIDKSLKYARLVAQRDFEQGKKRNLIYHGLMKPFFFFFKQYILKRGFLDGYYGFVIVTISVFEKYMRLISFNELKRTQTKSQ